jgi:hypothetical protein
MGFSLEDRRLRRRSDDTAIGDAGEVSADPTGPGSSPGPPGTMNP